MKGDSFPVAETGPPKTITPPKKVVVDAQLPTPGSTKTVGNVASKEQIPTTAVIGKFPSAKSSSPASLLLDKGFAMDQAKQSGKALEQYAKAGVALRSEIADALGAKLTATGLGPEELKSLPAHSEPVIFGHLVRNGLFALLSPTLQETTLKYFNRTGLAHKHEGDVGMAAIYCMQALTLEPKYGPAHYNLACATSKMENANGPTDIKARNKEVLDHLEGAIKADKTFFTKLALSDPDFNDLRSDGRFRALVGLPPLPEAKSVLVTYPSSSSGTGAAKLIDDAYELDKAKDSAGAIAAYGAAFPALKNEIALAMFKLDLDGNKAESASSMTGLKVLLDAPGLFEQLKPALQETTLKFFNRLGLAHKHEGNLQEAGTYTAWAADLEPTYGPALYNLACITLLESNPTDAMHAQMQKSALDDLGKAIKADPAFFTKLALSDPDFDSLRDDARFKALVGP